jgi:hypothetical protein
MQDCVPADHCSCLQYLIAAARSFATALQLQKGNIYAANGLGAVTASIGQLDAAANIFTQLRESAASSRGFVRVPDVRSHNSKSGHLTRIIALSILAVLVRSEDVKIGNTCKRHATIGKLFCRCG